jgi:hypothetical protein
MREPVASPTKRARPAPPPVIDVDADEEAEESPDTSLEGWQPDEPDPAYARRPRRVRGVRPLIERREVVVRNVQRVRLAIMGNVITPAPDAFAKERPKTRGDCIDAPRPCPWISCRYHLGVDPTPTGGIRVAFPDRPFGVGPESCALDVADRGGATLEEIGDVMGITRERTRQLEEIAVARLRSRSDDLGSDGVELDP